MVPDFASELAACMRYFQKSYDYGTALFTPATSAGMIIGLARNTAEIYASASFKVPMRATPTTSLISYNGTGGAWTAAAGNTDTAGANAGFISQSGFSVVVTSGLTAQAGYYGHYRANARL
jgi:hypothetical protein